VLDIALVRRDLTRVEAEVSDKDAGTRATTINRIADAGEYHALFDRLLEQPLLDLG